MMPALLVALDPKRASVRPFGRHRKDEVVPLRDVQVWKSGVARWDEQHGSRSIDARAG